MSVWVRGVGSLCVSGSLCGLAPCGRACRPRLGPWSRGLADAREPPLGARHVSRFGMGGGSPRWRPTARVRGAMWLRSGLRWPRRLVPCSARGRAGRAPRAIARRGADVACNRHRPIHLRRLGGSRASSWEASSHHGARTQGQILGTADAPAHLSRRHQAPHLPGVPRRQRSCSNCVLPGSAPGTDGQRRGQSGRSPTATHKLHSSAATQRHGGHAGAHHASSTRGRVCPASNPHISP